MNEERERERVGEREKDEGEWWWEERERGKEGEWWWEERLEKRWKADGRVRKICLKDKNQNSEYTKVPNRKEGRLW